MHIALFGATGHIGHAILDEALARGHEVTAVVRDPARLDLRHDRLKLVTGDVAQSETWQEAVRGSTAAIASLSARRDSNPNTPPANARILLDRLPALGVQRFAWVGGAGSLETAPGVRVIDNPNFPAAWKSEAEAQSQALDVFRASNASIDWTYISPAILFNPGERTGKYRVGGDAVLTDASGKSAISFEDFAIALADEIETPRNLRRRVTYAY